MRKMNLLGVLTLTTAAVAAPASRPASEIVLVRIGDKSTITQADYNLTFFNRTKAFYARYQEDMVDRLVGARLFNLYIEDHPDLQDVKLLEERIQKAFEARGVKTSQEFDEQLKPYRINFEDLHRDLRFGIARSKIAGRAEERGKDEEALRKMYDADPTAFNGTRMKVRHILMGYRPYDTPEQCAAKRKRLAAIREDLVSGRRTWEQCVAESEHPDRAIGGEVGFVSRHGEQPEPVAKAVFELGIGQTSDLVETVGGYHLLQVIERSEGNEKFEDAKNAMKRWLEWQAFQDADAAVRMKYPVVGVDPPSEPPGLIETPATLPAATRPAMSRPAMTRPAGTRPASPGRPAATRPQLPSRNMQTRPAAMPQRPGVPGATRPAPSPRPKRSSAQGTPSTRPR